MRLNVHVHVGGVMKVFFCLSLSFSLSRFPALCLCASVSLCASHPLSLCLYLSMYV